MAAEVGRLAVKVAGRDAGKECVIVKVVDKNFVLVDGNTRRRKCNIDHLQFLGQKMQIQEGASHEEVAKALESLGVKTEKKAAPRVKKETKAEAKEVKAEKKEAKPKKAPAKK
ncbi:MAG: 50S ribosomal protein L14e [DPANN group archaeon]|nr:50S ribosomal protein L14e [DPANN group archaeon]